jgi:hypothetical protein
MILLLPRYLTNTAMMIGKGPIEAAKESVAAAIETARELGILAEEMAGAAATGVLDAARNIGGSTARDILHAVTGTTFGVKVMAGEPLGESYFKPRPGQLLGLIASYVVSSGRCSSLVTGSGNVLTLLKLVL